MVPPAKLYLQTTLFFYIFALNSNPRGDAHCVNLRLTTL